MKILTATARTQGHRANDFHHCVEGELVWIGLVCAKDALDPDGGCGCGRSFGGLSSHRATTTAMVRDLGALDRYSYAAALRSSLDEQGWNPDAAATMAADLAELVRRWPVGAVVERRLDYVDVRDWNFPRPRANDGTDGQERS